MLKRLLLLSILLYGSISTVSAYSVPVNLQLTSPVYKDLEFSTEVIASPSGTKTAAMTIALDLPAGISLTNITPGSFYPYPSGTEMLALGISCKQNSDCRTIADGVSCNQTTNRCENQNYPSNSANFIRFDLGSACDVVGKSCYVPTNAGSIASLRFKPNKVGPTAISFDLQTTVGVIDNNQAISSNAAVLGPALNINVLPQCSAIDFDASKKIDIKDIQTEAAKWNTTNPSYDIDENGQINIKDIQYISSRWGEFCL